MCDSLSQHESLLLKSPQENLSNLKSLSLFKASQLINFFNFVIKQTIISEYELSYSYDTPTYTQEQGIIQGVYTESKNIRCGR